MWNIYLISQFDCPSIPLELELLETKVPITSIFPFILDVTYASSLLIYQLNSLFFTALQKKC